MHSLQADIGLLQYFDAADFHWQLPQRVQQRLTALHDFVRHMGTEW